MWGVVKSKVPFWGTLNNRCRIFIGTQKGATILTTTHEPDRTPGWGLAFSRRVELSDALRQVRRHIPATNPMKWVEGLGLWGLGMFSRFLGLQYDYTKPRKLNSTCKPVTLNSPSTTNPTPTLPPTKCRCLKNHQYPSLGFLYHSYAVIYGHKLHPK